MARLTHVDSRNLEIIVSPHPLGAFLPNRMSEFEISVTFLQAEC